LEHVAFLLGGRLAARADTNRAIRCNQGSRAALWPSHPEFFLILWFCRMRSRTSNTSSAITASAVPWSRRRTARLRTFNPLSFPFYLSPDSLSLLTYVPSLVFIFLPVIPPPPCFARWVSRYNGAGVVHLVLLLLPSDYKAHAVRFHLLLWIPPVTVCTVPQEDASFPMPTFTPGDSAHAVSIHCPNGASLSLPIVIRPSSPLLIALFFLPDWKTYARVPDWKTCLRRHTVKQAPYLVHPALSLLSRRTQVRRTESQRVGTSTNRPCGSLAGKMCLELDSSHSPLATSGGGSQHCTRAKTLRGKRYDQRRIEKI
jgi:hypothetical protein